jgi:hypothetical protein
MSDAALSEHEIEAPMDTTIAPANEPLDADDSIIAMVRDRKLLYDRNGKRYWYSHDRGCFLCAKIGESIGEPVSVFTGLYLRPEKRGRSMTRWEILAWANSEESRGWLVQAKGDDLWNSPQYFDYTLEEDEYRRARLLPDKSGIDESTVQGFEVEE